MHEKCILGESLLILGDSKFSGETKHNETWERGRRHRGGEGWVREQPPPKGFKKGNDKKILGICMGVIKVSFSVIFNEKIPILRGRLSQFQH